MKQFIDKVKGTIYGHAIGDALGLGTEGMTDEDMAEKYQDLSARSTTKPNCLINNCQR